MISTFFNYKRVATVDEAIQALNDDSKLLAGGHSLIPALKLRLNQTGTLIDIAQIQALKQIESAGSGINIGAAVTHADIASSELVKSQAPMIAAVAGQIGDVQVRNAGTIGGSIAHADPAADWPAALLAADASVMVQGKGGSRTIAIGDFFTGIFSTDLAGDEIITHIQIPSMKDKVSTYEKFAQPASRFALVGCAVAGQLTGGKLSHVRVAFTGVSDTPYYDTKVQETLEGKELTGQTIMEAVANLDTSVYFMGDHYASEEYRQHLAGVMLRRALEALS